MYKISVKEIGDVWYGVALDGEVIGACGFSIYGRENVLSKIIKSLQRDAEFKEVSPEGHASEVLEMLSQLYDGKPIKYKFSLEMERIPPFTRKALDLTARIPRGFVATYGGIARGAGNERAARAVGAAEASNPFAPIVPCHRVVDSKLQLHGYGSGLDVKRRLLQKEGVIFDGDRVAKKCLWTPK